MSDGDKSSTADKPELTAEEILALKKKKFEENPGDFIYMGDLVIGVRLTGSGTQTVVGRLDKNLLQMALGILVCEVGKLCAMIEVRDQKRIVEGNGKSHGVIDFVRGGNK